MLSSMIRCLALMAAALCLPLCAEDGALSSPRVSFLDSAGGSQSGCYVALCGKDKDSKVFKEPGKGVAATLNGKSVSLSWNFSSHFSLTPSSFADDPTLKIELVVDSAGDFDGVLRLGWFKRADGKFTEASLLKSSLKAGEKGRRLLFDLPPDPGCEVKGFYLSAEGSPLDIIVSEASVAALRKLRVDPVAKLQLLKADALAVSGQAAGGVSKVSLKVSAPEDSAFKPFVRELPVKDGRFETVLAKSELPEWSSCELQASISGSTKPEDFSFPVQAFVFPKLKREPLPKLGIDNGMLVKDGKPFAFLGINYTAFSLGLGRSKDDYALIAGAVKRFDGWGVSAVRLPLSISMIQAAEGVFPDNPKWREELESRKLDVGFIDELDYFLDLCNERGIYVAIDWHETPCDPYRYFTGGNTKDKGSGKPGNAIAWLCDDMTKAVKFDYSNPRHLKALVTTHAWMARHLKGRSNILGFEVPMNEPFDAYMSVQANWSRIVTECSLAIKREDPERLTFSQCANWAHNNEAWAFTWLNPYGLDGQGPHHYMANGPVPARKGAKHFMEREQDKTFALSMPSLLFASMVWRQPVYNGEGGEHGARDLLPELDYALAADYMYEATLAQCYAAGAAGHMNWTLLGPKDDVDIYAKHGPRYAKLLKNGPVDWSKAEVALIQNTEAVHSSNGQNYSVVPFVDLMLSLHLGPVHLLPDDYLIYNGLARVSEGLEQVSGCSVDLAKYKAVVVDRRNLDARVSAILEKSGAKILWTDNAGKLSIDELSAFLESAGVDVDRRSPPGIQIALGAKNVLLYRRAGEGGRSVVYPAVKRSGPFKLIDESGKTLFEGTSAQLKEKGVDVELGKLRSLILEIEG